MKDHGPVIAIATGGRKFWPTDLSRQDIGPAIADVVLLVEGEAVGFDRWVRDGAARRYIAIQPVPALWGLTRVLGLVVAAEGPKRNARMLRWATDLASEFDLPLVLIAGPGGTGTADMRRRCAHLDVREVRA